MILFFYVKKKYQFLLQIAFYSRLKRRRRGRGLTLVAQLVSSPWNQSGCSSLLLNAVFESSLFKALFRTATFALRFSARNSDAFSPAIRKSMLTRLNVSYRRSASVTKKKKKKLLVLTNLLHSNK